MQIKGGLKLSDKIKELVLKIVIVLGCLFGILFIVLPFFSLFFPYDPDLEVPFPQPIYTLWITDMILFFSCGGLIVVLTIVFKIKPQPVKAEKMPLAFEDYNSLLDFIQNSAKLNGYKRQQVIPFISNGAVIVFVRPSGLWKLDCIALFRVNELTDEILDKANNAITKSLCGYYGKETITDTISMITIVCVNRITPAFQKLVNSNIEQGFKNFRLPVGISFGGKQIYIAKQKDGFAITKYKKLRKEFLNIMHIQIQDKRIK